MSKESSEPEEPKVTEMQAEYDFCDAERGKYAGRFNEGSNVVVLDPDVAAAFPDAKAVNDALRKVAGLDQVPIRRAGLVDGRMTHGSMMALWPRPSSSIRCVSPSG